MLDSTSTSMTVASNVVITVPPISPRMAPRSFVNRAIRSPVLCSLYQDMDMVSRWLNSLPRRSRSIIRAFPKRKNRQKNRPILTAAPIPSRRTAMLHTPLISSLPAVSPSVSSPLSRGMFAFTRSTIISAARPRIYRHQYFLT